MKVRRDFGDEDAAVGCWNCSKMATQVRPMARPEPFSVCSSFGLPLGSGR